MASTTARERLSRAQARRVAIAAQGLAPAASGAPGMRQVSAVVDRIGLLQIDSVNVLTRRTTCRSSAASAPTTVRCSTGPPAARRAGSWSTGPTRPASSARDDPPAAALADGALADEAWGGMRRVAEEQPDLVALVLEELRHGGPMTVARGRGGAGPRRAPPARPVGLELVDGQGGARIPLLGREVSSAGRTAQFERRYDVIERVLPSAVLEAPTPTDEEAFRAADPDRGPRPRGGDRAVPARLLPAAPGGRRSRRSPSWSRRVSCFRSTSTAGAGRPTCIATPGCRGGSRRARCSSPFDPLVWERERVEVLFDFHYRIEIYVPPRSGCTATTCCRSCSTTGWSPGSTSRPTVRRALCSCRPRSRSPARRPTPPRSWSAELQLMAGWLGLSSVVVTGRGDGLATAQLAALG